MCFGILRVRFCDTPVLHRADFLPVLESQVVRTLASCSSGVRMLAADTLTRRATGAKNKRRKAWPFCITSFVVTGPNKNAFGSDQRLPRPIALQRSICKSGSGGSRSFRHRQGTTTAPSVAPIVQALPSVWTDAACPQQMPSGSSVTASRCFRLRPAWHATVSFHPFRLKEKLRFVTLLDSSAVNRRD